jgi:hypothetical protein
MLPTTCCACRASQRQFFLALTRLTPWRHPPLFDFYYSETLRSAYARDLAGRGSEPGAHAISAILTFRRISRLCNSGVLRSADSLQLRCFRLCQRKTISLQLSATSPRRWTASTPTRFTPFRTPAARWHSCKHAECTPRRKVVGGRSNSYPPYCAHSCKRH